jgi:hypothetical protein
MASEYGEQVVLIGNAMGDHADVYVAQATEVGDLALRLDGAVSQLESLEAQLGRVRKTAEEIAQVLSARTATADSIVTTTTRQNEELQGTVSVASQLLQGTQSQQALNGLANSREAVEKAGLAKLGEEVVRDGIAQTREMVGGQLGLLLDAVSVKIAEAKGQIVDMQLASSGVVDNLNSAKTEAKYAKDNFTEYGNSR